MKALVTGGGGFLGLCITEQLLARGDTVRVFCRNRYQRLDKLCVETINGDVRNAAAVDAACARIDTVFHTAAVSGIWGPRKLFHEVNTVGTRNIVESCKKQGVTNLVYTSSPSVIYDGSEHKGGNESYSYPDRYLCHYPYSKALAEKSVLDANGIEGLATVSLRPHLIWGPRDNHLVPRLIRRARSGRLRRVGDGGNLVSMTYVENAAAAHLQAVDSLSTDSPVAGQAYFINESEPVKLWQWIDELLSLAGLPSIKKSISKEMAWRTGAVMEVLFWLFRIPSEPPMTRFLASQLSGSHFYDISKAQRDFDYQPIVSVEEGMQRLAPELKRLARQ